MTPERILDWKTVASNQNGRRVLAQIIRECGEMSDVFCPGSPDKTAYNAGRSSVCSLIRASLNQVSPTLYQEIILERLKEEDLTKKRPKVDQDHG